MSSSPITVLVTLTPHKDKIKRVEELQSALTESVREHEPDTLSYYYYKADVSEEEGPGLVNLIVVMK